jgi:hypothetical protein
VREIDLGLDFVFATRRARGGPGRGRLSFRQSAEVDSHLLGFVFFQRTGMRLLLGHSDLDQRVENGFAFDFQLSCKIVDSNLTHPAFRFSVF